jgi:gliding motility-associated transport system ATP-binding protein
MSHMLDIRRLTKRFGALTAVDEVSFTVDRGEVLGFLGPNGAGKSTTMKIITGFLPASDGEAHVCGFEVGEAPIEVKKRIGYLPEGAPLYEDMTPAGLLAFVAEVRGFSGPEMTAAIERAAARIHIEEVMYQPIGTLSKGFKRRLGLAQAILHDPEVLILDEPTDGLDPNQKHEVRALIKEMAPDKAIVISTHLLEEVDAVCSRAIIINRGRIVADGTPAELEARSLYHNAVRICVAIDHLGRISEEIAGIEGVARIETGEQADGLAHLVAVPEGGRVIVGDIAECMRRGGIPVEQIHVERGHLDDVFRQITTAG